MMAPQPYTHACNISLVDKRRLCINGTPWIWHLLEECVENAWEYWSVVIGLISIVCFLFAALPQLYVAYQNGKVDQALSLGFLLCWIGGDLANFIGCYLTNRLPIQVRLSVCFMIFVAVLWLISSLSTSFLKCGPQNWTQCLSSLEKSRKITTYVIHATFLLMPHQVTLAFFTTATCAISEIVTAIFYVNMDIIVISQFAYYKLKNQMMNKCSISLKNFCVSWVSMCITLGIILPSQLLLQNQDQTTVLEASENTLGMSEMSGFICGYISCVFYLGSRFPQLYKNFQRRSTEGTSYLLFALAMMGNCTYGLSLVLKMPAAESLRNLYFLHQLPWLFGSFGVLFLDIFMTAQFIIYRKQNKRRPRLVALEVEPLLVNEEDS